MAREIEDIIRCAGKFRELDAARRWAVASNHLIVMGDHDGDIGIYWTVRPVDAVRLERSGYEIVT